MTVELLYPDLWDPDPWGDDEWVVNAGSPPGPITFPTTKLQLKAMLALGADLSADPGSWNWVDISAYVRGAIHYRVGKTPRSASTTPASLNLRLDNFTKTGTIYPDAGRFARRNPNSPLYGLLSLNNPIWIQVDPGSGLIDRAFMFVNSFPPTWSDPSASDSYVDIECTGWLGRLANGGREISILRRTITGANNTHPVIYVPFEDLVDTKVVNVVYGDSTLYVRKPPLVEFGGVSDAVASKPYVKIDLTPQPEESSAASFTAVRIRHVVTVTVSNYVKICFLFKGYMSSTPTATMAVLDVRTSNAPLSGTGSFGSFTMFASWDTTTDYFVNTGAQFSGQGGAIAALTGFNPFDGNEHFFELNFTQSGSNILRELWIDNVLHSSDSVAHTLDTPIEYWLRPGAGNLGGVTVDNTGAFAGFGHIGIYTDSTAPRLGLSGIAGVGETATARLVRVCAEEAIPLTMDSPVVDTPAMGPQVVAKTYSILRDCEAVDQGMLYDGPRWSLGYRGRQSLTNQPVVLALDADSGHVNAEPIPVALDDNQDTRNLWTLSRSSGGEYTDEISTGTMGTGSGGPGVIDDQATVNVATDELLKFQATWRTWLGTADEDRWVRVGLNFDRNPTLIPAFTTMRLGDRVTIAHPPDGVGPDQLELTADGYEEVISRELWTATLTTSANSVNRTFDVAATTGDTSEWVGYLVPDTWTLDAAMNTTQVTFTATVSPIFSTDADDWTPGAPIEIGGERMLLTGVSGGSSPQTFTVTRSTNTVVKSHAIGDSVDFVSPGVLGL